MSLEHQHRISARWKLTQNYPWLFPSKVADFPKPTCASLLNPYFSPNRDLLYWLESMSHINQKVLAWDASFQFISDASSKRFAIHSLMACRSGINTSWRDILPNSKIARTAIEHMTPIQISLQQFLAISISNRKQTPPTLPDCSSAKVCSAKRYFKCG